MLSEMIVAMGGKTREEPPAVSVAGVSTDSRTIRAGELFVALRGETFDGHAFVADALRRGAAAAVVERSWAARADSGGMLIAVDSPLAALGRLAAFHRRQSAAHVIAVVGSNGKTTTKAMIDHILAGRWRGRSSPRSFNNAVGVPLTLLSSDPDDEYLVVEIGTNSPGEVASLARLVEPELAVVTSIGEEHLEGLTDLRGVIREELSILDCVRPGGFAAVNIDTPSVRELSRREGLTVVTFGRSAAADLRIEAACATTEGIRFRVNGRFDYRLGLLGEHHAENATAAIAVARRLGWEHDEIAERLATFAPQPMRGQWRRVGGVTLINDAYNANPASAAAAVATLAALDVPGRRILVFGEMRELGASSEALHRRVAQRIGESRIDIILLVGRAAEWMQGAAALEARPGRGVEACASVEDAGRRLDEIVGEGDAVLVKASRAVGLERALEPLLRRLETAART